MLLRENRPSSCYALSEYSGYAIFGPPAATLYPRPTMCIPRPCASPGPVRLPPAALQAMCWHAASPAAVMQQHADLLQVLVRVQSNEPGSPFTTPAPIHLLQVLVRVESDDAACHHPRQSQGYHLLYRLPTRRYSHPPATIHPTQGKEHAQPMSNRAHCLAAMQRARAAPRGSRTLCASVTAPAAYHTPYSPWTSVTAPAACRLPPAACRLPPAACRLPLARTVPAA